MLIGHYAPALLLKRARPTVPLWIFFLAAQAVDVLWGVFILTGVERVRIVPGFSESNALDLYYMPWSHSVVATLAWSALLAGAWAVYRRRLWEAVAVGAAVASHFLCDLLVHLPDLPIFAGDGAKLGLGLWRHRTLALVVEGLLFAGAAAVAWNRRRAPLLIVMMIVLVVSFYVPTPPTPAAMAATGLVTYALCCGGAAFADRRR